MASYDSTTYTKQNNGSTPIQSHGLAGNLKVASATVAVDTSLALNDLIHFFILPKGATVRHAVLKSTDIDSNASPTIKLDVGDSGSTTRLFSASTVGQAGGADNAVASTAWEHQFSADTAIYATVNTAGATKVAGTVGLTVFFTVDGLAD